jgi:hypothetical protein
MPSKFQPKNAALHHNRFRTVELAAQHLFKRLFLFSDAMLAAGAIEGTESSSFRQYRSAHIAPENIFSEGQIQNHDCCKWS